MKKIILLIVVVALVWVQQVDAQVGINTTTSASDRTAKNARWSATTAEGFLNPGLNRQKAQDMINAPVSSRIFINSFMT